MGTWSGNQGRSKGQGVAGVSRVHLPTDGWSPLGQGTKNQPQGTAPPKQETAQPPPMPGPFLKEKAG